MSRLGDTTRQGWAWTRWVSGWVTMHVLVPSVVRVIQQPAWCRRWRNLTDTLTGFGLQVGALAYWGGLLYLFGGYPVVWLLVLPGLVVTGFGIGRHTYRHTPRGRARYRYGPEGWADWDDLRLGAAAHAAKEVGVRTRPSIARQAACSKTGKPSDVALARMPATEFGTWMGNTAVGAPFGTACYAPHETVIGLVAPPRSWKTALMGHSIIDHPGPVLSTQTKSETWRLTRALREDRSVSGRIDLLDPEGLTGEESTFRWSPVTGCRDPQVAMQRAIALSVAADKPGEDGEWFSAQAAEVLQLLLLIADITGKTMTDVARWATSVQYALKAAELVQEHRDKVPAGWLESMVGVLHSDATKTRGAIMLTLKSAVGFMLDPKVARLCTPDPGAQPFDVAKFLADQGTVYLIASERQYAKVGPLLAAFTSHLFEEAKTIASRTEGTRLDPPLLLSLDEVANTITMPLDRWVTDAGGRGIQVQYSMQSFSQARTRWGVDGASTIGNATGFLQVAGGLKVKDDLAALEQLCTYREWVGEEWQTRQLLTAAEIREIPRWHGLLLAGTMRPALTRLWPVWIRRDVIASLLRQVYRPKKTSKVLEGSDAPSNVTCLPRRTENEVAA